MGTIIGALKRDWNGDCHALEQKFMAFGSVQAVLHSCGGTEAWHIDGMDNLHREQFKELCRSGMALLRTSPGMPMSFIARSHASPDDYSVWLSFVKELYGGDHRRVIASTETRAGKEIAASTTQTEAIAKL